MIPPLPDVIMETPLKQGGLAKPVAHGEEEMPFMQVEDFHYSGRWPCPSTVSLVGAPDSKSMTSEEEQDESMRLS